MLAKKEGDLHFLPTEILDEIFYYCHSDSEKLLEKEDIEFLKKNVYSEEKYVELYCETENENELRQLDKEWGNILDNLKRIVILVTHKKGSYIKQEYLR